MTSPKPAAAVDLEALKRQLQTEPSLDEYLCARCRAEFSIDDGLDPSIFCHNCAHEVAESALPALIAELEQLRAGAPRWIAVSERMPDDEQPVWLHQDGWSVVPGYREFDVWRHREDWRISQPSGGMQPTHWAARYEQPVPSPPEAVRP